MTRDNILFSIIGLLLGCIVGFLFANSYNQSHMVRPPMSASQAPGDLPPNHPPISTNGVSDASAGAGGAAMPEVQQAIKQARDEPNNFDAQLRAADLYNQIGRYDDAIQYLMRANQIRPDDYTTVVKLGDVNYDANHFEVAEKWYTAALQMKPNDVNVRTDLGTTFVARTPPDFERAIAEYQKSLQLDPKHEKTLHNLVIAYTKKGDTQAARDTLARLEAVNPQAEDIDRLRSEVQQMSGGDTSNNG